MCDCRTRLLNVQCVHWRPKSDPIFVALGAERNSAIRRADLADLTAFVAVADNLGFRAEASRALAPAKRSHAPLVASGVREKLTFSVSFSEIGLSSQTCAVVLSFAAGQRQRVGLSIDPKASAGLPANSESNAGHLASGCFQRGFRYTE